MLGEIGFSEILLIMVIALIVVGPERLPGLARKAGKLVGRGKRFVQNVRDDINQEIAADELKRIIDEQKKAAGIHEIIEETEEAIDAFRDDGNYALDSIEEDVAALKGESSADQPAKKKASEKKEGKTVEKDKQKAKADEQE